MAQNFELQILIPSFSTVTERRVNWKMKQKTFDDFFPVKKHWNASCCWWWWCDDICLFSSLSVASSRPSDSGEEAKAKGPALPSFLPFYFRVRAFSIQRPRLFKSLEQAKLSGIVWIPIQSLENSARRGAASFRCRNRSYVWTGPLYGMPVFVLALKLYHRRPRHSMCHWMNILISTWTN